MQTLQERQQYWGKNFTEIEKYSISNIISLVDEVDADRPAVDMEDAIYLKVIRKWKPNIVTGKLSDQERNRSYERQLVVRA